MPEHPEHLLFGYSALLKPELQREIFGRVLDSHPDVLPGYTRDFVEIDDSRFADLAETHLQVVPRYTGNALDKISGRLMSVTDNELDAADDFEDAMFRRLEVTLASGHRAWMYVLG